MNLSMLYVDTHLVVPNDRPFAAADAAAATSADAVAKTVGAVTYVVADAAAVGVPVVVAAVAALAVAALDGAAVVAGRRLVAGPSSCNFAKTCAVTKASKWRSATDNPPV